MSQIKLPDLPEGYFWKVGFGISGNIDVEVYRSFGEDHLCGGDDLVAYKSVKNDTMLLGTNVQDAIAKLHEKITRGVAILSQLE